MASLGTATNRTAGLVVPAALVIVGSLGATAATNFLKNNVYDIPVKGGDAAYPVVVSLLLNAFVGGAAVRNVSLGMLSSAITTAAKSYGLV
jgi:hypothetical protein